MPAQLPELPVIQELRERALARAAARAESQQGSAVRQQQQQQPAATRASPMVWGTPQYSSLWQMAMAVGEQQQQQGAL